ncbi:hypothetical protein SORBI_3001G278900 [Sorghum bicolor]|uniref:Uncharacterized protein n=1 Tax=Sorghum bicolor TaxID=4558 RepID=A0A1B6QLH4_SORBI|nr:hypothetical protein SORBI_3001G278900 [Sorghum bicolor]
MPSPPGDGVIKKLPRDVEAGARMVCVCVSTERSLLVCVPGMHAHPAANTCMQRMPHRVKLPQPNLLWYITTTSCLCFALLT